MNTRPHNFNAPLKGNLGSALIALIAAILIFSVLAAALLPMVSSSGEQTVLSSLSDRADLLAGAGFRYVKSRYDNAPGQAAKNAALEDLDNDGNFTLSNGEGEFQLSIYSYFFPIRPGSYPAGNQITANPPARLPIGIEQDDDNVTPEGLLSVDGEIYTITSGSIASADDNATFTVDRNLNSSGTNAYPAVQTTQTSLMNGGTLSYLGQGGLFPLRNGRITISQYPNPLTYGYNDRRNSVFTNVRDLANPDMNVSWPSSTNYIVLNQYTRVRSVGIVGGGELKTRRQTNYYISGEAGTGERVSVELGDFQATTGTTITGLTNIGLNEALAITQSTNNASLLQSGSNMTQAPLDRAHRRGDGLLSYDTQVKLGFYSGTSQLSESPVGIIPYAAAPVSAGITFRLNNILSDTSYNGYGLSFVRANNTSPPSNIFSNIVPSGLSDQPLMVLWQQTGEGVNWLAYKRLQPRVYPAFPNVFDDVMADWAASGNRWNTSSFGGREGSPCFVYSDNDQFASLRSPLITLNDPQASQPDCDGDSTITLAFWVQERVELSSSPFRSANISYNGGATFSEFAPTRRRQEGGWYPYTYDLSGHSGQTIQIRLDIAASPGITVEWSIDDVQILYEHCRWPIQNATLLVRLKEATVVRFTAGGPQPIIQGDRVYCVDSGTQAMVMQPPLVASGAWSASSASGTLLLDNVVGSGFDADGEDLRVAGRTGGIGAHLQSYDNATERKVNIIKTFYASESGSGTASSDPSDPDTLAYPRRDASDPLLWPPEEDDNWTSAEDYFRLVQWDAINDDNETDNMQAIPFIDSEGRLVQNAVIRSHHPDLQSPPLGQSVPAELGLHAYGAGADNVYFDDFGLWLYFGTSSLFDTVLQQ